MESELHAAAIDTEIYEGVNSSLKNTDLDKQTEQCILPAEVIDGKICSNWFLIQIAKICDVIIG